MRKIGHVGDCHLFSTCSFQKSRIVQLFWGIASFDACQYCLTQLFTNLGQLFESHTIVTNIYMLFTKARVWRSWIYATLRIMSLISIALLLNLHAIRKYGLMYFDEWYREFYEWVVIINSKVVTYLSGRKTPF